MTLYRIKDWQDRFESAKSRTYNLKSQTYMPNKQGVGYMRIMREKDGPAIYGTWCAIVSLLSRQQSPRHGYLTDTGQMHGKPFDAETISMLVMIPARTVDRTLSFCCSKDIEWLQLTNLKDTATDTGGILQYPCQDPPPLPSPSPSPPPLPLLLSDFEESWKAYPDKSGKEKAREAYTKWRREGDTQADILAGIARYRAYVQSKRENGHDLQWRNGSTFFNQRGWQDEWAAEAQGPVADRAGGGKWDLNSLGTGGL